MTPVQNYQSLKDHYHSDEGGTYEPSLNVYKNKLCSYRIKTMTLTYKDWGYTKLESF